jgi:PAS domain S-box-containing protein
MELALRQTQEELAALYHATPLGLVALRADWRVKLCNPAAESILGWKADEITGSIFSDFVKPLHPDILPVDDFAQRSMPLMGKEVRHYRQDGTPVDVSVSLAHVRDASGRVARRFTSDTAKARERRLPVLPTSAGAHRVVWDITYEPPVPAKGQLLWGYSGGVKAPPGRYTVTLSGGATAPSSQTLTVRGDPRLFTTAADYDTQFRVALAVRDTMTQVNEAIASLRAVREQVRAAVAQAERVGASPAVSGQADSLVTKGDALEGRLTDPRHKVGYDILRFGGRLDNQLNELYGNLTGTGGYINGGADAAPTKGQLERTTDLTREWNAVAAELRTFFERDVTAFNAAMVKLGLPPVTVPRTVLK